MDFSNIEPYRDDQVTEAMHRIATNALRRFVDKALNHTNTPLLSPDALLQCTSVDDFQHNIMQPLMEQLIAETAEGVTCEGIEQLNPKQPYLFVSNHRDIFLDAAMLDVLFLQHGLPTMEISFGDNLLTNSFVTDLFRLNRMFPIHRKGSKREQYMALQQVSHYIRYAQQHKGASVWIAQRNGRSKDGNDFTEQGLIKMFALAAPQRGDDVETFVDGMDELHIVPVAVSYEIEPCLERKARELYIRQREGSYVKTHNEDMESIIEGIMQPKGHIHYTLCRPLQREELIDCASQGHELNNKFQALRQLIDRRIHLGYKLYDTNREAYDAYCRRCAEGRQSPQGQYSLDEFREAIYANPVINRKKAENHIVS